MGKRRGRWRFRVVLSYVIVIGVVLLSAAALAHAQGPNSVNGPSSILDEYKGLQNGWIAKLLGAAQRLFFLLAGIEVAWSFTLLAIEKADFQALTATIVRKIMWIGIFYAILLYGVTPGGGGWIPAIIDSFHILGQNASSVGPLGPSAIVGFGVNMCVDLLSSLKGADFLTSFASSMALVFCAVVIFIAYLAIAIQFVVAMVESYLVIGAGVIFLGFGGSRWTAAYVERYIAYAVSVGMKILVLYLLVGAGMTVSQGWIAVAQNAATSPDPARTGFDLAAAAVMFLCVCWMSPKISSAMLGGVASMSGGDLTGVGMGVGLAAVGAGVVATQYATRGSDALSKVKRSCCRWVTRVRWRRLERSQRCAAPTRWKWRERKRTKLPEWGWIFVRDTKRNARWSKSTRASVPSSRRPNGWASNPVRPDPGKPLRMIPSSVRSNVRQRARTMR